MEEEQQQQQEQEREKQPTTTGTSPHSDPAFALKMLVESRNAGAVLGTRFFAFVYILRDDERVFFIGVKFSIE